MYDILYNDPALFEITIVLLILVGIAIWQKLYRTASVMCAVFIFYLIFIILTSESVHEIVKTETNDIHDEIVKNEKVDKITIQEISDSTIKETKNYEPDLKAKIPEIPEIKKILANKISVVKIEKTDLPIVEDTLSADIIEEEPITVLNIAIGSNIVNRSIEIPDSVFSLDIERIYCLTHLRNWNDSKTIYHKWYQEGELRSKISLEIGRSFNWRTWSYITVYPERVGDWKVIVEDSLGVRYDSLSFKIMKEPID
jgi:Ca2+/Na+ antiporter